MAFTLTRNLRLRLDSNLSVNSKYNLERLDLIGSVINVDTLNRTVLRSRGDVVISPNDEAVGGTGTGGTVTVGELGNPVTSFEINATSLVFNSAPGFLDQGAGGTKYLRLSYQSDINGPTDTASDRTLRFDLQGADRELVLGSNFRTSGGNVQLVATGPTSLTLPTSGTLATLTDIIAGTGDVSGYATGWFPADGLTKSVAHLLQSTDIIVSIIDMGDNSIINTHEIQVIDSNNIQLTGSELPGVNGWRIVVHAK